MKSIFLILITTLLSYNCEAQVKYSNRLVDLVSNEPVEGAVIQSNTGTTLSERDGVFT